MSHPCLSLWITITWRILPLISNMLSTITDITGKLFGFLFGVELTSFASKPVLLSTQLS